MDNDKSKYTVWNFIWMMLVVFGVWLVYGFTTYMCIGKWNGPGTFGDMFSAINALFSGLAFAGIIFTILLQREELKFQREELKLTRKELNRTASAQEISQQALSKQAKTLQITARINAINTLIGIYQEQRKKEHKLKEITELNLNMAICQNKLEDLVKTLEK